ncbi:MAG: hypothetical protein ACI4RQ_06720 [Methanobrevibacter wolinii]
MRLVPVRYLGFQYSPLLLHLISCFFFSTTTVVFTVDGLQMSSPSK